jgi:hypothetical protein
MKHNKIMLSGNKMLTFDLIFRFMKHNFAKDTETFQPKGFSRHIIKKRKSRQFSIH